ncbi:MAG: DUF4139 domain-containing protein [Planctomycetota bacterium]|jgi:hypothetical protein
MRQAESVVIAILLCGIAAAAEKRETEGVGLTIYTTAARPQQVYWRGQYTTRPPGYATVKEWRRIRLERGLSRPRFTDVASDIRPETVHFTSLTDPEGTFVVEQNYEYDLVSATKLLAKYIDRPVTLLRENKNGETEEETVTLLSAASSRFVVRRDDAENPIEIFTGMPRMRLGSIPGGLISRPTLVWSVRANKAGNHLCKVTYETLGVSWKASYTALTKGDDTALDLSGWVTIENRSGGTYRDAQLKLVAGDVHAGASGRRTAGGTTGGGRGEMRVREGGFTGKSFFEFHLYTLARRSTLKDNSQKQIELFAPVRDVPARKLLVYHGARGFPYFFGRPQVDRDIRNPCNTKVDVYLAFMNSKAAGLGIPLPAGTSRVYKEDPDDGSPEFVGEDETDHAPAGEEMMLRLGSAFDLVGERRQTDFKCAYKDHWMQESFEIIVRNHKETPADVVVREVLYRWVNWEVARKTHDFVKKDSRTIHFPVKVPADGEVKLTYTVKYTW